MKFSGERMWRRGVRKATFYLVMKSREIGLNYQHPMVRRGLCLCSHETQIIDLK